MERVTKTLQIILWQTLKSRCEEVRIKQLYNTLHGQSAIKIPNHVELSNDRHSTRNHYHTKLNQPFYAYKHSIFPPTLADWKTPIIHSQHPFQNVQR